MLNWDHTGKYLFTAGCDNNINLWRITGKYTTLRKHNASVQCVECSKDYDILVSGLWDKCVKYQDIRSKRKLIGSVNMDEKRKIYAYMGYRTQAEN